MVKIEQSDSLFYFYAKIYNVAEAIKDALAAILGEVI